MVALNLVVDTGEHSDSDQHDTPKTAPTMEKPDRVLFGLIDI